MNKLNIRADFDVKGLNKITAETFSTRPRISGTFTTGTASFVSIGPLDIYVSLFMNMFLFYGALTINELMNIQDIIDFTSVIQRLYYVDSGVHL
jgi:hypothetical protein